MAYPRRHRQNMVTVLSILSLLLFALNVSSTPLTGTTLHKRARFPGNVGQPSPPPVCNPQTSDPSLADCENAVKRSVQQFARPDGTSHWNFVAAFEFHDQLVAPSFGDILNAIALPRVTKFGMSSNYMWLHDTASPAF